MSCSTYTHKSPPTARPFSGLLSGRRSWLERRVDPFPSGASTLQRTQIRTSLPLRSRSAPEAEPCFSGAIRVASHLEPRVPRQRIGCSALALVVILLLPRIGLAASGQNPPPTSEPDPAPWGQEVALFMGAARNVQLSHSKLQHPFLDQAIEASWRLTATHGSGRLAGRLELLIEADPAFVMWQNGKPVYGFGVLPVFFRWNFSRVSHLQPFADLAGGFVRTNQAVPVGTVRFNFMAESGAGLRLFVTKRTALLVGYRFHHLSNADRASTNPGINSNLLYVGASVLR